MALIISEILIIFLLVHFITKQIKKNKELKKKIFSLKVQAALEDFYSDKVKNKKKRVKTFKYRNYRVKK
ncbi:hypothetical protein [Leptotrichia hongkongensis]|uniref:hypothetical protein n=1 Tax=Leptotrichia hongkongensis TaxID=554406 RepID=UPI0035A89109